uniref:Glutaminase n=1 Tax=Heligmosomoides polygyrus TaxID=6339 RepID=A0A183GID7_HELPZ
LDAVPETEQIVEQLLEMLVGKHWLLAGMEASRFGERFLGPSIEHLKTFCNTRSVARWREVRAAQIARMRDQGSQMDESVTNPVAFYSIMMYILAVMAARLQGLRYEITMVKKVYDLDDQVKLLSQLLMSGCVLATELSTTAILVTNNLFSKNGGAQARGVVFKDFEIQVVSEETAELIQSEMNRARLLQQPNQISQPPSAALLTMKPTSGTKRSNAVSNGERGFPEAAGNTAHKKSDVKIINVSKATRLCNSQPKQMSPPLTAYILDAEKYMPSNPAGGFYQENQTIRFNGKAEYRPFANVGVCVTLAKNVLRASQDAIRSKATRIGCSIDACLNDDIVGSYNISGICFFEEKEIEKGDKVYKVGDPCVKNSDCDENEVCTSYSLCYKSKLARKASHMHNELRSDLAMGKVENKNSKKFPKASFMFRLTYSDFLERTAYEQAELWDNSESGPLTSYRNQSDSNNYFWANRALVTQSYATDKEEALKWVCFSIILEEVFVVCERGLYRTPGPPLAANLTRSLL